MSDRRDGADDDGVSSDDLLKEAKGEFGLDDGSSGVADSLLESSVDEPAELSAEEIAAELAASSPEAPESDATDSSADLIDGAGDAPSAPETVDYPLLPGDQIEASSDPPPIFAPPPTPRGELEPAQAPQAEGFFAKLRRNWWIVAVVVVGISVVAGILDTSEPISSQGPGDCFDNPSGDEVTNIEVVDCDKEHELEVFAIVQLSGSTFPGDFALADQAFDSCLDRFEGYVGQPYATSTLYAFPFTPTEGSWDAGDRDALCVVYEPVPNTDGEEIAARTGSVRGSGL